VDPVDGHVNGLGGRELEDLEVARPRERADEEAEEGDENQDEGSTNQRKIFSSMPARGGAAMRLTTGSIFARPSWGATR